MIGLYATGSLSGGYYRPGQSDIDAVLIVANESEQMWGNDEKPSKLLEELNQQYLKRYKIPFGLVLLQEKELYPPYDPHNDFLPFEIARLKLQGKPVYGQYNLDSVPMPTAEDFLVGIQCFEEWYRDEFSRTTSTEMMSPVVYVNTILIHLSRFLIIKRGLIEFDKRKIVSTYLDNEPPFVNKQAFDLVMGYIALGTLTEADTEILKGYVGELRSKMNAHLGIVV